MLSRLAKRLMQSSLSPCACEETRSQETRMPVDAAATHHATQGAADGVVAYAARRSTCRLIDVRQTDLDRRMVLGVDDAIRRRTREQSGTLDSQAGMCWATYHLRGM